MKREMSWRIVAVTMNVTVAVKTAMLIKQSPSKSLSLIFLPTSLFESGDHGWIMNNGSLEPRWLKEAALTKSLADILHKEDSDSNNEYDCCSKDSNTDQTISLKNFAIDISSNFHI